MAMLTFVCNTRNRQTDIMSINCVQLDPNNSILSFKVSYISLWLCSSGWNYYTKVLSYAQYPKFAIRICGTIPLAKVAPEMTMNYFVNEEPLLRWQAEFIENTVEVVCHKQGVDMHSMSDSIFYPLIGYSKRHLHLCYKHVCKVYERAKVPTVLPREN